jgi:hypothetical protein
MSEAVRTLLAYTGSTGAGDALFACTESGIWDCTTSGSAPVRVVYFPNTGENAGYGISTNYVALGGKYLLYCDEDNGLFIYDGTAGVWAAAVFGTGDGQISGVDPSTLVFVTSWKNRLWFVARDSTMAWYLPVGQIAGVAESFEFGTKLRYGGELVGLWSWTGDGGFGIDDFLVAISTAGDVAIYQGTDPTSASYFALKGVWYVGGVPAGRRIATDTGGDLLILTPFGVLPISALVSGGEKLNPEIYPSKNIKSLISNLMATKKDSLGWDIRLHPVDNSLLILVPGETQQLAMAVATKGWSTYQGVPMTCCEVWQGTLYFGTSDGRVCVNDGWADNVALDGTGATAINWGLLGSFQELGVSRWKRVQLLRPDFITTGETVAYSVSARFDFDLADLPLGTEVPGAAGDVWDLASWDGAKWSAGIGTAGNVMGSTGIGSHIALELTGSSMAKVIYAGCQMTWDVGGVL